MALPRLPSVYLGEEHEALRKSVAAFVGREIRPHADAWEAAGEFPRELYRTAGDAGFLGVRYEERWGGSSLDFLATCVLCEELVKGDSVGTAVGLLAQSEFALSALADEANDTLKETWLAPAIRSGPSASPSPAPARTSPRSRPGRAATAATT
jgi:alkylation response protein AidB-like acyl-CoA dehydrogenase